MTALCDSLIFRNIFSTPEASRIWSDTTRTAYYVEFERALAAAQSRLGIIPTKAGDEIQTKCKIELIDMEELARETERIGYPVLGVVKQIVKMVNLAVPSEALGEYTHWGATTQACRKNAGSVDTQLTRVILQDVTDTATVMQMRDTLAVISASLQDITAALRVLCETHKSTPMPARSNLQQAVPISFGFKMARLLATFERHQERLAQLSSRLLVVEFGGAAGTLATIQESKGLILQAELAKELGLGVPSIAWHTERDRIAEFGSVLALLTGTCAKFVLDVKLMMQSEVGEVSEPFYPHRGSSSTMPQKRNPITSAYVTAMDGAVRALSGGLLEAMVADHERSTGAWEIEWIVLPQICTLTCAALKQTAGLAKGLEVHPDAMMRNLGLSKGGVVSEAVMMGLAPSLGRQVAHDLVYELCRTAIAEDRPLVELLSENEEVKKAGVARQALDRLCDPANYLGLSVEMTERVLSGQARGM